MSNQPNAFSLQRCENVLLQEACVLEEQGYEHLADHLYSIVDELTAEKEIMIGRGPIITFSVGGRRHV